MTGVRWNPHPPQMPPGNEPVIAEVIIGETQVLVEADQYTWNHTRSCLGVKTDKVATIVALKATGRDLPYPLNQENRVRVHPDLGREHVSFVVNAKPVDLTLYGMDPGSLKPTLT